MNAPVEYVAARAVLLDAVGALSSQAPSAILVGAQAVYLRTGADDFAVAPMTTDADLALGPSALLVAKIIKISERLDAAASGRRNRVSAKDALDVLRLLRAVEIAELVAGLRAHRAEEHAAAVSARAIELLREHSARPSSALPALASAAVGDDSVTAASFVALANELASALDS